jgi:hypothetical protein
MSHLRLFVALTAVSALTMAGTTLAQSTAASTPVGNATGVAPPKPTPTFKELDKKGRGYLLRSDLPKDIEGLTKLRAHYAEADVNQDGRISRDEYDVYTIPDRGGLTRGLSPRPTGIDAPKR